MRRHTLCLYVVTLLCVSGAHPASAVPLTGQLQGTITTINDDSFFDLAPPVGPGDRVSFDFQADLDPDDQDGNASRGFYLGTGSYTSRFGEHSVAMDSLASLDLVNASENNQADWLVLTLSPDLTFSAQLNGTEGLEWVSVLPIEIHLGAASLVDVYSDDGIPSALELDDFASGYAFATFAFEWFDPAGYWQTASYRVDLDALTLVPEPATACLLGLGMGVLGLRSRRHLY